jgi:diguanylate cyclase (GGDEF)-like protein
VFPLLLILLLLIEQVFFRVIISLFAVLYVGVIIFNPELIHQLFAGDDLNIDDESDVPGEVPLPGDPADLTHLDSDGSVQIIDPKASPFSAERFASPDYPNDLKEKFHEIATENIPDKVGQSEQFYFVVEKLLKIIQESYQANSAIFFKFKKRANKLQVARFATFAPKEIIEDELDILNDVLSGVFESQAPEVIPNITGNMEADLVRYYKHPQGIRSLMAVPVFYHSTVIGVLVVDSKAPDVYGIEAIYSVGRYVRLMALMVQLYEERFSENISQQRLEWLIDFLMPLNSLKTHNDIIGIIEQSIESLMPWKAFALVLYDPEAQNFYTAMVKNSTGLRYIGEKHTVDIKGTIVGKTIIQGKPQLYEDTSEVKLHRYSAEEDIVFTGSFLTVPLIYNRQNYGVLCFDHLTRNAYTAYDVNYLKSISSMLSFVIYSFTSQHLYQSMTAYDMQTNLLNERMFYTLLKSEFLKTKEAGRTSSLLLMRVDDFNDQESLFDDDPLSKIIESVSKLLREEAPQTALLGRVDERNFGAFFFNFSDKDAFVWAEKFRIKVARLSVQSLGKQLLFAISCGIASTDNRDVLDTMRKDAESALRKAISDGGNKITNMH